MVSSLSTPRKILHLLHTCFRVFTLSPNPLNPSHLSNYTEPTANAQFSPLFLSTSPFFVDVIFFKIPNKRTLEFLFTGSFVVTDLWEHVVTRNLRQDLCTWLVLLSTVTFLITTVRSFLMYPEKTSLGVRGVPLPRETPSNFYSQLTIWGRRRVVSRSR